MGGGGRSPSHVEISTGNPTPEESQTDYLKNKDYLRNENDLRNEDGSTPSYPPPVKPFMYEETHHQPNFSKGSISVVT